MTGRFLRLGRQEYLAAISLDGKRDAAAVIEAAKAVDDTFSLTEKSLLPLLGWLARGQFIASGQVATRGSQGTTLPHSSKWVWDPFAARFPLIKGAYVEKLACSLQFLVHPYSVLVTLLLVVFAFVSVIANWQEFFAFTEKLFVAEGRVWWLVAWLLLKLVHELGHAVTAIKAGSQIRSAGISFIFMAPVPFIDVSDLWSISNRWQRILCSMGGMLFEITVAAAAVLIACAADGDAIRYLACAIAITGTFTTLAFNANPLVRFDGYFILADLVQKSNLWGDGQIAARQVLKRFLHPFTSPHPLPSWPIALYGLACMIYRLGMLLGLSFTALLVWQEYGVILIAWGCGAWFVIPWWKGRKAAKLAALQSPRPSRGMSHWGWVNPILGVIVFAAIFFLPVPMQPRVPGVVTPREPTFLRIETEGFLSELLVDEQQTVQQGELIARFENPLLHHLLDSKRVEVAGSIESIAAMRARGELAEFQAEQAKLASLQEQLAQLEKRVGNLEIRSPVSGTVLSSDLRRQVGKFFTAGAGLACIGKPGEFEIKLAATQQEHARLQQCLASDIEVTSSSFHQVVCTIDKLNWRGSDLLDEPVLAASYGGPITVAMSVPNHPDGGIKLSEPRFEVRLRLQSTHSEQLVAGQIAWAHLPNSSARLVDFLCHWVNKKWEAAKRLNKNG